MMHGRKSLEVWRDWLGAPPELMITPHMRTSCHRLSELAQLAHDSRVAPARMLLASRQTNSTLHSDWREAGPLNARSAAPHDPPLPLKDCGWSRHEAAHGRRGNSRAARATRSDGPRSASPCRLAPEGFELVRNYEDLDARVEGAVSSPVCRRARRRTEGAAVRPSPRHRSWPRVAFERTRQVSSTKTDAQHQ
jgi:hypothetical protein